MPDNTLAEKLLAAREARGMTQRALSDASGITEMVISRLERGATANPELATVIKLASALGVSVADLVPRD
jgi:transcriptional regulator with XRE-family HTH domain